jgi:succinyl-diaminopimelate desuccinylase
MPLDLGAPVEDLARALIDIPSVSGDESALADQIEAALAPLAHLEVTRLGDAVVARTSLGRAERVILAGHIDTVPIARNVPATLSGDGTELIGRGAVDMKSGVAVMLALAGALTEPHRDLTFVFYDHEEVEAELNGLGRIGRERPDLLEGDFAILGEPTAGVIEGGCNGTLRADVTLRGVAAHSARSWKGLNAIHLAAPLLARLAAYKPFTVEVDGLEFREGLNAVGIRGGIAGNVIPDECTVSINFRFAPTTDVSHAQRRLEIFVHDTFEGTDVTPELVWTDLSAGARPGLTAPLAKAFADAVARTGAAPPRAKQGWTDVARFGVLGIPAVNYGPGDPELAHADDERCEVAQIRACREALASWLAP